MIVYLLSHYAEDGSIDVTGYASRTSLIAAVNALRVREESETRERRIRHPNYNAKDPVWSDIELDLKAAEEDKGQPVCLTSGWGGYQIHCVEVVA